MENPDRKITGYRELSQAETDLINEIKAHGEKTAQLLSKVITHLKEQRKARPCKPSGEVDVESVEYQRILHAGPDHWAKLGQQDLQTGLMFLTRAVAQPTTF